MIKAISIARQAGFRLVLSLSLLVILVAAGSVSIYHAALKKAGEERVADLLVFYQTRMEQI